MLQAATFDEHEDWVSSFAFNDKTGLLVTRANPVHGRR